ncbi:putative amylovoran biosynthesis glycosyltransferase AmsE [Prevotella sp. BV3P1]|uniref:glycosyltransferase n=1 Tax=Prevotellaceae TaxID=171552 RepID=UPI0003B83101|nr:MULTISPECIES: glycosyltransferase [Prevotellaceae]ERT59910.1 putative amylovoran biosynthesis glycosyltransferase AmsE [Prevotella sp. BV3P1]KGF40674.1 glycosyl transferase [Hoylesella buccalis DNF00985]
MSKLKFSVIMSIYKNDNPEYLQVALDSIIHQTQVPDEIVLIADGPVPQELIDVVDNTKTRFADLHAYYQDKNRGLGGALRIAVEKAQYDYLARMDSDDISLPDRFEKQMRCFEEDHELAVVGGMITEFVDSPEHVVSKRILPLDDRGIKRFMQSRCGVNHVTVVMKKSELLRAGNYQQDFKQEDYFLWARMIEAGCKFRNIPDIVVNVRSGRDQFARRGGMAYYKDVLALNKWMWQHGLISLPKMIYNDMVRGTVQFLLPNNVRTWVYQRFLRK